MKKIMFELDIDGPAFNDNPTLEISRILKGLGYMFQDVPINIENIDMKLCDKFGQEVGFIKSVETFN